MKITFKTTKPTGRFKSFYDAYHEIKVNGISIGIIDYDGDDSFNIRLKIVKNEKFNNNNPNCKWIWIKLTHSFNSLQDAKDKIKSDLADILERNKIELHLVD